MKKQYGNAVAILEKSGESGLQSEYNLFLLALAFVYSNDFGRAGNTLNRIERINPYYVPYVQLKSFLSMKSALSREGAIGIYIEALEVVEDDRLLKKILREVENSEDFPLYQKTARLRDFVVIPKPSRNKKSGSKATFPIAKPLRFGLLALILSSFSVGIYLNRGEFLKLDHNGKEINSELGNDEVDRISLGNTDYGILNRVNRNKTAEFYYSKAAVVADFERSKKLIKGKKYNEALLILNRINNSNVNYIAREKVEFLIKFVINIDERKYGKSDFKKVKASPHLYRGVSMKAAGKTANVINSKRGTSFTLMVDYSDDKFSEIVNVYTSKGITLNNGEEVEVSGIFIPVKNRFSKSYISSDIIKKK